MSPEVIEEIKKIMTELEEESKKRIDAIYETVKSESDRGCILVLSGMIDNLLEKLLENYFQTGIPEKPTIGKELVDGFNSPLGTFSSRIKMAYVLNFLTYELYSDLEKIRGVRNDMAHSEEKMDFSTQSIHDKLANLSTYHKEGDNVKKAFLTTTGKIMVELMVQLKLIERNELIIKNRYKDFLMQ